MSLDVRPLVRALEAARLEGEAMQSVTMTFCVFVEDDRIAAWVEERTRALAEKHPARVVIFDGRRAAGEHKIAPADKHGEWIEIGARGTSAADLDAAIVSLELSNIPLVVLWAANGVGSDERFLALARRATATICSSSLTRTDGGALHDLMTFVGAHPEIAISDIAYLRLTSWQELIAEFFDRQDERAELPKLRSVELAAGSDAEMYYVLGWLASRLAWQPGASRRLRTPGGMLAVTMNREGPPRRLSRIVLASESARFVASVHPQDDATICLEATTASGTVTRCAPLHTVDLASLVERAILAPARDEVFLQSLSTARSILEADGS